MVVIVAVVLIAGAGGAFWILRSHPAPKAVPHEPCEPLAGASPSSSPGGPLAAGDWVVSVSGVRVAGTLPNHDGIESFRLPTNLVYLVVDAELQNSHPGREAALSSPMFQLVCQDGTTKDADGLDRGEGFCVVCSFELGLSDESLTLSFAFKIRQGWTDQAFSFEYGTSQAIRLPTPTAA